MTIIIKLQKAQAFFALLPSSKDRTTSSPFFNASDTSSSDIEMESKPSGDKTAGIFPLL